MEQKTKFDNGTWKHEIRKISDPHPNPNNPRVITKEVSPESLIKRFGLREPNFAALNKEGLFTIVDKLAIEDWKNTQPAWC